LTDTGTETGLVAKCGLDASDIAQVRALEEACCHTDGIDIKFNWSMMDNRESGQLSDFCYYQDGQLVGYMPLDAFGDQYEITAAVLPAYRRQGIFRLLFAAARQEAQRRKAAGLLLVNYRASAAGTAATGQLDVTYKFSEYCMVADVASIPPLPASRLQLVDVTPENVEPLSHMLDISFGNARYSAVEELLKELQRSDRRYFLARFEDTLIGQIGVLTRDDVVYIRAVGIMPEWRNQGYGRQLLATVVSKMLAEGHRNFELDVATENSRALSLYQACGFHETNVYDYYTVPLS
jgi:ribosomal protein S18 acetylase RimI-like enzyme